MGSSYGHLQIATEVSAIPPKGNDLHWITEEGAVLDWEVMTNELGGYGRGTRNSRPPENRKTQE